MPQEEGHLMPGVEDPR